MASKKVGFTAQTQVQSQTKSGTYYRLQIPVNTVESLGLKLGDVVKLQLATMDGKDVEISRKTQAAGGDQLRVDIPKKTSNKLQLSKGDLVDVWIQKQ